MTTTVIVKACCNPEKTRVRVRVTSGGPELPREYFLESGENAEYTVYDQKEVTITEIPKVI
jgi:hypothetical protein